MSLENGGANCEKDLSAEEKAKKQGSRLQKENEHIERQKSFEKAQA